MFFLLRFLVTDLFGFFFRQVHIHGTVFNSYLLEESLSNGSLKDINRKISGELFTQLLQQEIGYVLACVGIDIQVRMLELSCFIGYSTSSLKENLKYYYKTYTQCNLTDLKEWITKYL